MTKAAVNNALVAVHDLHKHYRIGHEDLHVLRGVDLKVDEGQWLAVLGASGSGKSTLLHLIGGLDTPDHGGVRFRDGALFALSTGARDRFRNQHVGFVFQFYHLLPELNVMENTMLPGLIGRSRFAGRSRLRERAMEVLEEVGLGERLRHRPNELSGGERQRVAIARALLNEPDLVLADEPTGNLDQATGQRMMEVFERLHARGQTIVMVTHDAGIAERADRVLTLERGKLQRRGGNGLRDARRGWLGGVDRGGGRSRMADP